MEALFEQKFLRLPLPPIKDGTLLLVLISDEQLHFSVLCFHLA